MFYAQSTGTIKNKKYILNLYNPYNILIHLLHGCIAHQQENITTVISARTEFLFWSANAILQLNIFIPSPGLQALSDQACLTSGGFHCTQGQVSFSAATSGTDDQGGGMMKW